MMNRPCWVEVSTGAFERNFQLLAEVCGSAAISPSGLRLPGAERAAVEVLAIVKADAYGHSLELCAPAAARAGARWLGVTSVEEGAAARRICEAAGFPQVEILAIGGPFRGQGEEAVARRLTPVVWESWQIDEMASAAQSAGATAIPVHLELDTGMSRQGVSESGLEAILERLAQARPWLRLGGLMTHLYAADEMDGAATRSQFARLGAMLRRILPGAAPESKSEPIRLHVGNSAAALGGEALDQLRRVSAQWGLRPMLRPGLALYGLMPEFYPPSAPQSAAALQPVLEWKTQVVSLREIPAGEAVGYNGAFVANQPMRLALLAVGYADGLKRALSNRGAVLIRGRRAPVVGRISMDQTVVDATGIDGVAAGDEAVLLGRQGQQHIAAGDHARWAETIPWEILTSIAGRVERRLP